MSEHPASSFVFSVVLHAAAVIGIFLFTHFVKPAVRETPKVFELVMGEGENFLATEAPESITVPVQTATITPEPERAPAIEVVPPPEPKQPAKVPAKTPEPKKAPEKAPPAKDVKAKQPTKQISFEDHKKLTKDKKAVPPPKQTPPQIAKIRESIVSSANKKGGAGGTAAKTDQVDPMIAYDALLRQKLKAALDKPLDVSDELVAEAVFMVGADGSLTRARIVKSSDDKEFDKAVLDAIGRTRMPERPDHKSDEVRITFRMKDEGGN